MVFAIYDDN